MEGREAHATVPRRRRERIGDAARASRDGTHPPPGSDVPLPRHLERDGEALREEHFGFEAATIAREEEAGFFHYERPRVYGRN